MIFLNEGIVVVVRGLIAFFTLLIFARLLGKQQISQLTFFEYVLGISIGSIAATMTTDLNVNVWNIWVGLVVWTVAAFLLQVVILKSRKAAKYIDGEPTVVIMNGQVMEGALRKMRFGVSEILELLRVKGVFDLTEVEFAVLETSGNLSVLKKSEYQPVTPKDLKLPTDYKGLSTELIYDGVVIDQNLKQVNLNRQWLYGQLAKQGVKDPAEVFLAVLDTAGNLYVDTYRDKVKRLSDPSDYPGVH